MVYLTPTYTSPGLPILHYRNPISRNKSSSLSTTMARSYNETTNSSSGEEEEEASSEKSESESEPDKTSTPPPSSKKSQLTPNSSSDDSESESETDAEKPQLPEPNVKPLASKPLDDDHQSKQPRSKNPTSRYSPPPLKSCTGKRPAAEGETGDLKRIKKETVVALAAPDADTFGEKKQLFQRLWSEDNEIELIQGMIDYVEVKGKDPLADVNDFHEFVKKSLHVDVNNRQVLTKARRLKKKYENNVAKVENKGKSRTFSNPHEKKMYELSKNLWGSDGNKNVIMSSSTKKVNVTPKTNKSYKAVGSGNGNRGVEVSVNEVEPKMVQPLRSVRFGDGLDPLGSVGLPITEEVIKNKGLELLSGPKNVEMEEKWKNLKVQELKHFLKKVDLLKEQAELVLNAISKSADS